MKKNSRMYFSNIVVLLLLPYLITILINGYDMAVLNHKADSETVLTVILQEAICTGKLEKKRV